LNKEVDNHIGNNCSGACPEPLPILWLKTLKIIIKKLTKNGTKNLIFCNLTKIQIKKTQLINITMSIKYIKSLNTRFSIFKYLLNKKIALIS
jgi:hypothetical protein